MTELLQVQPSLISASRNGHLFLQSGDGSEIKIARVTFALFFALFFAFALTSLNTLEAQKPDFPKEVIDSERSVRRQSDAATAARKEVQSAVQNKKYLPVFPLLGDASGRVRDAVFKLLVDLSSEEMLSLLESWNRSPLQKGDPGKKDRIEIQLAEILHRHPVTGSHPFLLGIVSSRKSSDTARELAVSALGNFDSQTLPKKTIQVIEKMAQRDKSWWVRGEAIRVLAKLTGDASLKVIDKAWQEKKSLSLRLASLQALAEVDPAAAVERSLEMVREGVKDRQGYWGARLRRGAFQVLSQQGSLLARSERAPLIEELISLAGELDQRFQESCMLTLEGLTGISDLGKSVVAWDSWWRSRGPDWIAGEGEKESPESERGDGAGDSEEQGQTGVVEYHGIPIDSSHIVFVSDVSGGMSRTLDGSFDGDGLRRIEVAKSELLKVLGSLPGNALIQVVFFASQRIPVLSAPQLLSRCIQSVSQKIKDQGVPQGPGAARGNLYSPLRFALFEPGIDTIILLTEGAATEGFIHDGDRIRWHVRRWNRWGQVKIHVLSLGSLSGKNRQFLEGLATDNGGEFHDIDDRFKAGK